MNFSSYLMLAVCLVVFVLVCYQRHLLNELKLTKCKLEVAEKELKEYAEQVQRLSSSTQIVNKNRKESDEKIDSLHKGDSVVNALDELHK